ncbi:MAG: YfhO family protein [bacterium]|nr:YfhO family protein [bacterium]
MERVSPLRFLAIALALPFVLLGASLLPGRQFLPQHPAGFAPLAAEREDAARRAWEHADLWASDGLFPFATDALALHDAPTAEWNPTLGLGSPVIGHNLLATYPPNVLHRLLPPGRAFGWLALLALALAGAGTMLLLRERGAGWPACALGAVAHQAGAFGLLHLHYAMQVSAALWLPWCLFAVERLAKRERAGGPILFGATAMAFLAGFPPIAVFVAAATLVYALARARSCGASLAPRAAGWLGLGVLGAAFALLPMLDAARSSPRGRTEDPAAETLPSAALSTIFVPGLFGTPQDGFFAPNHPLAWWLTPADEASKAETASSLEWNAHAGVAALILALAAVVGRPRRSGPFALGLLATFGFAFGWAPFHWITRVPGFDLGAPGRALAIAWCLWPLLAARGFEALVEGKRMSLAILTIVTLSGAVLGAGLWRGIDPEPLAERMEERVAERHGVELEQVRERLPRHAGVRAAERLKDEGRALTGWTLAILACGWLTHAASKRRRVRAAWLVVPWIAIVGGEGVRLAQWSLVPRHVPGPLFPPSPAIEAIREAAGTGRVVRLDESASGVAEVERLARPNLLSAYHIADLTPYVVFPSAAVATLLEAIDPRTRYRSGVSRLADVKTVGHPALDVARVTCVLALRPLSHPALEEVWSGQDFHVYRRSGARPEAEVFAHAGSAAPEPTLQLLAHGGLDPARNLFLSDDSFKGEGFSPVDPGWIPGSTVVRRPAPDRVEVMVTGSSGGWLVLYDGFAPGWRATVNGEATTVHRAQHLVRAVRVPAGDSTVVMRFAPSSVRAGATLSVLALLAAGFLTRRGRA